LPEWDTGFSFEAGFAKELNCSFLTGNKSLLAAIRGKREDEKEKERFFEELSDIEEAMSNER